MRSGRSLQFSKGFSLYWLALVGWTCTAHHAIAADLIITDAWVRLAPPTASVNAVYMSVKNPTEKPLRIVRVTADCCAIASFHNTISNRETASMVHLDELIIPAASSVVLAPGGLHIMLMQSDSPLIEGKSVQLELELESGVFQQVKVPVKSND